MAATSSEKPTDEARLNEAMQNYFARRNVMLDAGMAAQRLGIGLGEVIHALTDWVGIEQCPRCQRWQRALDKLRVVGWKVKWGEVAERAVADRKTGKIRVIWITDGD